MTRSRAVVLLLLLASLVAVLLVARSCATDDRAPGARDAVEQDRGDEPESAPPERRRATPVTASAAGAAATAEPASVDAEQIAPDAGETEVVVTVRDASGRAVPGVEIAWTWVLVRWLREERREAEMRSAPAPVGTDSRGVARFAVPRGDGAVRLFAADDAWAGDANVTIARDSGTVEAALVVVPAFRLAGRVVLDDGTPLPGAEVYVAVPLPGYASRMPRRLQVVQSDDEGRFGTRVHPVPETRVVECYVMAGGVAGTSKRFPVTRGLHDDVELVVPRGTVVRGRCVDEEGNALPGVRVRGIMPATGEVTFTARNGRFALPVPGNGGGLIFFVEGRVQTALRDLRGPPEGVDVGDVLIPRGGTIAGRLVEADGSAIAGADVHIGDPWSGHAAAKLVTDARGAFRSDVIGAGTHFALARVVRPDDPAGLRCWFRFDGLRAGDTELTLVAPRGVWLDVVVNDVASGEPLEFEMGVFTLTPDDASGQLLVHHVFETAGETRSAFRVQVPGPGTWLFGMELPVSGRAERRAVEVGEAAAGPVVLTPR